MKAGTQESGTERGTEVRCGPRAIITVRTGHLYWWTGLEWTGLTQKSVKCLFQCRTEAKHTYLFACIAYFRVFLRVGRGRRSHAYEEHLFTTDIELQSFAEA